MYLDQSSVRDVLASKMSFLHFAFFVEIKKLIRQSSGVLFRSRRSWYMVILKVRLFSVPPTKEMFPVTEYAMYYAEWCNSIKRGTVKCHDVVKISTRQREKAILHEMLYNVRLLDNWEISSSKTEFNNFMYFKSIVIWYIFYIFDWIIVYLYSGVNASLISLVSNWIVSRVAASLSRC